MKKRLSGEWVLDSSDIPHDIMDKYIAETEKSNNSYSWIYVNKKTYEDKKEGEAYDSDYAICKYINENYEIEDDYVSILLLINW